MPQVTSKDGTAIAYDLIGQGPAVVIVGGILGDRSQQAPLAQLLASHFTVYNFDRRGRGQSGETPPYAVEREVEVPSDLREALERDADAKRFFEGLSNSNKQRIVLSIEGAKTAETRLRRITKAISELREGRV